MNTAGWLTGWYSAVQCRQERELLQLEEYRIERNYKCRSLHIYVCAALVCTQPTLACRLPRLPFSCRKLALQLRRYLAAAEQLGPAWPDPTIRKGDRTYRSRWSRRCADSRGRSTAPRPLLAGTTQVTPSTWHASWPVLLSASWTHGSASVWPTRLSALETAPMVTMLGHTKGSSGRGPQHNHMLRRRRWQGHSHDIARVDGAANEPSQLLRAHHPAGAGSSHGPRGRVRRRHCQRHSAVYPHGERLSHAAFQASVAKRDAVQLNLLHWPPGLDDAEHALTCHTSSCLSPALWVSVRLCTELTSIWDELNNCMAYRNAACRTGYHHCADTAQLGVDTVGCRRRMSSRLQRRIRSMTPHQRASCGARFSSTAGPLHTAICCMFASSAYDATQAFSRCVRLPC